MVDNPGVDVRQIVEYSRSNVRIEAHLGVTGGTGELNLVLKFSSPVSLVILGRKDLRRMLPIIRKVLEGQPMK